MARFMSEKLIICYIQFWRVQYRVKKKMFGFFFGGGGGCRRGTQLVVAESTPVEHSGGQDDRSCVHRPMERMRPPRL